MLSLGFLDKTLQDIVEREMSDFLNLMQEPQTFCLPQTFKKITVYFSFSKRLYFFVISQASIISPLHIGFDMPIYSCKTLISNQVEEKQQLTQIFIGMELGSRYRKDHKFNWSQEDWNWEPIIM